MNYIALLLAISALPWAGSASCAPVTNSGDACAVAKTLIVARDHLPESAIAFCDDVPEADGRLGYFVLALHSNRYCDGVCSTNMGWFAVEKSTGDVFNWDVAEWKLGQPISSKP